MTWPMLLVGVGLVGVILIPGFSRQNDDPQGPQVGWVIAWMVFFVGVVWAVCVSWR